MPNDTPATATPINTLPFTDAIDVAGRADSAYVPTCDSSVKTPAWYVYTVGAVDEYLSVSLSSPDYNPILSVWNDDLTPYVIVSPGTDAEFCYTVFYSAEYWVQIPLAAGTQYFFQVTSATTPGSANLTFQLINHPGGSIAADDLCIPDDHDGFPAAVISTTLNAINTYVPFPAGESGCVLLDGTIGVQDGEHAFGVADRVAICNRNFTRLATATLPIGETISHRGICSNRVDSFYVLTADGSAFFVHQISLAGAIIQSWTLPEDPFFFTPQKPCVSRDDTILYYAKSNGANKAIARYDLSGSAPLSDLHAGFAGEALACGQIAADDTIWYTYATLASTAVTLRQFDAAGSVLQTIALGGASFNSDGRSHLSSDDLGIWIWADSSSGTKASFKKVRLSDGAVLNTITDVPVQFANGDPGFADLQFGISNSCPLLVLAQSTTPTIPKAIIWPVWLNDGTFIVFTGTYLGNGTVLRFDLDGNLVKSFDYDHADFPSGMYNQAAQLDDNSCLPASKGMIWLAGHHSPPIGTIQPGVQPIDIKTGDLYPIVNVQPTLIEVDISAGLTTFEYSSSDGEPTDQGLPPKPTVSCGPLSNLKTPMPNRGCTPCGIGSTPTYTGVSGVVPAADDPTDEVTLTGKRDLVIWVEIVHVQYNDDETETTEILRYACAEPPQAPRREGRLAQAGTLEQASSDGQGNMKATSGEIVINDFPGRPIATRRADRTRLNFNRDEITVFAISDVDLRNGLTPKMLARGLIYGDTSGTPVQAKLSWVDHLHIEGGSFSPDKTMPMVRYPLTYYTNAPTDLANYFMPVIYGEVTDARVKDPTTGELSECGKCTPRLVDPVSTLFGETYGRFNNNLMASYAIDGVFGSDCGGLGCWGMFARSDGKGPNSTIGLGGRGDFSTIPAGGWAQLILWSPTLGRTEHRILKVNIAANSVKVEGQLDAKVINGQIDWMIERIDHAPRRVKIDIADRQGFDVMIPGYAGYTRSTPYEDFTTPEGQKFRVTDFGIRGPLLQEHMGGGPTIATNTIGIEDQGNASGLPIVDGFTAFNHWWDNFVHEQRTTPPISDNLWPQNQADLPQWSDGLTKTMQSSFAVCQALTARSLGGYGLRIGIVFDEGISLRDACQLWNDNLGARTVNEEHGRVKVWMVDKYADVTTWPRIDHANRVFGTVETPRLADEAMNVVRCGYDWDPDQRLFRVDNATVKSKPAIRRNKLYEKPSKHYDFKMLTLEAYATYRMNNILGANQDGPIRVPIDQCDLGVFDFPIGTGVIFTSIMGPGVDGYVNHPIMIEDRLTDLDQQTVNLLALDVGTDMAVVPAGQQFIATNNNSIAPVSSNDPTVAPMAVA